MSVKIHNGDIFEAPVDIIIHQCNYFNTMGAGIAKEIKKRFPNAYAADQATRKGDKGKLGSFSFASPTDEQDQWIINLYGQYKYGTRKQYANYFAVEKALTSIRDWVIAKGMDEKTIGIPYGMGCGLGGGDWKIVEDLIQKVFRDESYQVLICKK